MYWEALKYSDEEFHALYEISNGFNDDINKNHRTRETDETFASFMDEGMDSLIKDNLALVKSLL